MLRERGLIVDDSDFAQKWIEKVGYYRLKGYGLLFREPDTKGNFKESLTSCSLTMPTDLQNSF